jgi:putrescine importer
MAAQLAVIAAFIVACVWFLQAHAPTAGAALAPFMNSFTSLPAIMGGAAVAAYSFLGFDAVTTLSEETIDPTRNIPRATVLAAAAGGCIFMVTAYLMTLVHPGFVFKDLDNAGFEILAAAGGNTFLMVFTGVLIVSYIAAVMCAQAGSSRLLYVMGRDGVMPVPWFAYLHPRLRTPVFNILLMGLVMLAGEWVDVETAASCVNFGAFSAFLAVNLCVLIDHKSGRDRLPGCLENSPVRRRRPYGAVAVGQPTQNGVDGGPELAAPGAGVPSLPHAGVSPAPTAARRDP